MLGFAGFIYSIWLTASGSPIFWSRARPTSTRPVVIYDHWFRIAGIVYLISFLLLPRMEGFEVVIRYLAPLICYVIGLWRVLSPKVM